MSSGGGSPAAMTAANISQFVEEVFVALESRAVVKITAEWALKATPTVKQQWHGKPSVQSKTRRTINVVWDEDTSHEVYKFPTENVIFFKLEKNIENTMPHDAPSEDDDDKTAEEKEVHPYQAYDPKTWAEHIENGRLGVDVLIQNLERDLNMHASTCTEHKKRTFESLKKWIATAVECTMWDSGAMLALGVDLLEAVRLYDASEKGVDVQAVKAAYYPATHPEDKLGVAISKVTLEKTKAKEAKEEHKKSIKCYNCDRLGHYSNQCTAPKRQRQVFQSRGTGGKKDN